MDIVEQARELMYKQTQINKAPAWKLTEIAIEKGKELAKKYNEDEGLILTSLYLAHTVFDRVWGGEIQKAHPKLSAELGIRQVEYDEAKEKVIKKMEQKRSLLTLEDCIKEAEINCKEIIKLFS